MMVDVDLTDTPDGTTMIMANGDKLVMNRDYPRPAFDVFDASGVYQGYLYPYHVAEEYGLEGQEQ